MNQSFVTLLPAGSFKRTPWKNGGGITSEIAIFPAGSSLERGDFFWRLSSADVALPGPFSDFAGFERLITLVDGKEMVLRNEECLEALVPGEVFRFSGAEVFRAELPHGPVVDLGLIFRPARFGAEMRVLKFANRPRSFQLAPATNFFYVVEGDFSAEIYPGDSTAGFAKGDALRIDPLAPTDRGERLVLLQPGAKGGCIVAIEILPR